jgi:hypothetical protein
MKKTKGLILGSTLALLVAGGVAQASSSWKSYNLNVGSFNGSAYTAYSPMSGYLTTAETINVHSFTVGGDYTVDIRGQRSGGVEPNTSWIRSVGDSDNYTITRSYLNSGDFGYRLQISNDLTTPVKVNVTGEFRTN